MRRNKKGADSPETAVRPGKRGISVKWKLFTYLALFTAVILVILWLCQVVFLDSIYKIIKISEIRISARLLTDTLLSGGAGELESRGNQIATRGELCLLVLRMVDENTAVEVLSVDTQIGCAIHNTDKSSKFTLYDSAVANGGELLQRFRFDASKRQYYSVTSDFMADSTDDAESIIYTLIADTPEGDSYLVMLNSVITPVSATVQTLNILLGIISVILLLLSLLLAFIISRSISKPMVKINESANQLAAGNYGVAFSGKGYREINELADTLNYASAELAKVEGLRRELIANISHDLRTPLTMIEGYGEVIRDLPGENTPENVQIIIDEANRLTSLVNDILDISKLQSGTQEVVREEVNLTASLRALLDRYNKLVSQGYTIEFLYDGEVTLETDGTRVTQVVYNLVNNAVTYTGADKRVTVRQSVSDGRVRISVSDTGEGIPPDKLERIWDRYYKVDKVHRRASVGTGLGLSIVKSTMLLLGGTYGVDSEPGVGSTFWVELPLTSGSDK